MGTVYLDSVVALNAAMDYLLLLASARLAGIPLHRRRYFLAGVMGGLYAAAVFLPGGEFLSALPVKLAVGVLLALIAYGGEERLLRLTLLWFLLCCSMAGCVLAVGLLSGGGVPVAEGIFFTDISLRVLLVAASGAYLVLAVVFRAAAGAGIQGRIFSARLSIGGKETTWSVLYDSGNALRDPLTAQPVLVAAGNCAKQVLPPDLWQYCSRLSAPAELVEPIAQKHPELRPRLIPYHAVGVTGGLLLAVTVDWGQIQGRRYDRLCVALAPTEFAEGYQALWGGTEQKGRGIWAA